jgi:Ca2+-binding EF-hand superfamily protein
MKNFKSQIALFILAFATVAEAASAAHRGGGPGARGEGAAPGDGERVARHGPRRRIARAFRHMDVDENGVITLDEFLAKPEEKAAGQFDRIDVDDDQLISLAEFSDIHDNGDGDNNDDIDRDELQACIAEKLDTEVPDRPDIETRFDLIDTNADGSLDIDEFTTAKVSGATDKFNQIDTDADGALTPEELMAALGAKREHRQVRRECVEEQRDVTDLLAD